MTCHHPDWLVLPRVVSRCSGVILCLWMKFCDVTIIFTLYCVFFSINPLNPRSKYEFSFVAPIYFLQKLWGEVDNISDKYILCDHVCNSHDHSVLQSIDITRRNLMLITLRTKRVNKMELGNFVVFFFFIAVTQSN